MMDPTNPDSADDYRLRGNHEFAEGRYDAALTLYTLGLQQLDAVTTATTTTTTTTTTKNQLRGLLLCNRSATYYQHTEYELAQADAQQALELDANNTKAYYRLFKAQGALHNYKAALSGIADLLSRSSKDNHNNLLFPDDNNKQRQSFVELQKQLLLAQQQQSLQSPNDPAATSTSLKDTTSGIPLRIQDFIKHETLGHGNFSEILIVTHRATQEQFALKQIVKKQAADLAKRQHPNVYNEIQMERRVLLERLHHPTASHPNIIRMYQAFADYTTVYYLMELHTMDLWNQCQWQNPTDNTTNKKWMIGAHRSMIVRWMHQLIDAVEHLHRHGIVHRDLKTENVLLNAYGHVVVIDLGTAKDLRYTDLNGPEFVGTPDFMSPEAVTGDASMENKRNTRDGATHAADLWALGAMLYLMHTGMTPFWCPSPYLAFLKIKRGRSCLRRPQFGIVDDAAWDMIHALMAPIPQERLGANAFVLEDTKMRPTPPVGTQPYDVLRQHSYLKDVPPPVDNERLIPSLRDLCLRPLAQSIVKDAHNVEIVDAHPPGDGSSHDVLRLDPRDRNAVLHILDRQQLLSDPRLYARFFADPVDQRLNRIRTSTHDFVGWTQMNDDQGKTPKAKMNDPYGTPISSDPVVLYHLINPLWRMKPNDQSLEESTRKGYIQLLKKSISYVNKTRPNMVVATGWGIDAKSRKLLARISDSIPVVVHDGTHYFQFWISGIQCLALTADDPTNDESNKENAVEEGQLEWIREHMEQSRLSKHPLLCFFPGHPMEDLSMRVLKRLARGKTLLIAGVTESSLDTTLSYQANEMVPCGNDDTESLRSVDSDEEDEGRDAFTTRVQGTSDNGVRIISVDPASGPDHDWSSNFHPIGL